MKFLCCGVVGEAQEDHIRSGVSIVVDSEGDGERADFKEPVRGAGDGAVMQSKRLR